MTHSIEVGSTHGRLTVQSLIKKGKYWFAKCKCSCGNECTIQVSHIRSGASLSCGCIRREGTKQLNRSHGMCGTRLDTIYKNMKRRCYKKATPEYKWYGKRGIVICDEWMRDKSAFFNWANSSGYDEHLTLDRMDNDGPYAPWNCRWITRAEQCRNRRSNVFITYNGTTMCKKDWAIFLGVSEYVMAKIFRDCDFNGKRTIESIKQMKQKNNN